MQNTPATGKLLTPEQRAQLEADYTYKRLYELTLDPVRGNFDAAYLKDAYSDDRDHAGGSRR